jgi:hypothetical protein
LIALAIIVQGVATQERAAIIDATGRRVATYRAIPPNTTEKRAKNPTKIVTATEFLLVRMESAAF